MSSIGVKAVHGATWTIAAGMLTRGLGLLGSIGITYFIHPDVMGEVGAAVIFVQTAHFFSILGLGHYLIAKPDKDRSVTFHITALNGILGLIAVAAVILLSRVLGAFFHVAGSTHYLPWLVVGLVCDRVGFVPERLLVRQMNFRRVAFARSSGDLTYTVASIGLAFLGFGGFALVYANLLRSALRAVAFVTGVKPSDWLTPARLQFEVYRDVFEFSSFIAVQSVLGFAASKWDNLLFARMYGAAPMARYNLAYNLADIPADQIGEQIAEVLLPSFARMAPADRDRAVVETTGILALIIFPLSIGLGAVADTLVKTILPPLWRDIGPMLAVLAVLSVARPLAWQAGAYFLAVGISRYGLFIDAVKLFTLMVAMLALGQLGQLWACVAVGLAFVLAVFIYWWIISNQTGRSVWSFVAECIPPLAACGVMVAAVLAVRYGVAHAGITRRGVGLGLEVLGGGVAYLIAAPLLARSASAQFFSLLKRAYFRRKPPQASAKGDG